MRRVLSISLLSTTVLAISAASAFADGSQTVAPTAKQKTAIVKAWASGGTVPPGKCVTVQLSKLNRTWAGLKFNSKASGCTTSAFDGTAILWGRSTDWTIFKSGSSVKSTTCRAMQSAMGQNPWVDLVDYAGGMGCENVD